MLRKSMILVIALLAGNLAVIQAQTGDEVITVPGTSLTEKLAWLQRSADSHNTYIVEVNANENIAPHTLYYEGGINITVILRGDSTNRTIRLRSHGSMFTVRKEVTFILDNNITLRGHSGNNASLVCVNGGTLKMNNGATITDNTTNDTGGGVWLGEGTFEMNGGTISNNTAHSWGGGVIVEKYGGVFTMHGGTISGNNTFRNGGGVHVSYNAKFTMSGGTIMGNTARDGGGGVGANASTFIKTGGIITGYKSDPVNGNVIKDEDGNVIARKGHAIIHGDKRKETTAGPNDNFTKDGAGPWDQ